MEALSLEEARKILLSHVEKREATEEVSLWEAKGRVLSEDVVAPRSQPPFPRSPLDGYAVRSQDLQGADRQTPVQLTVVDEVMAGYVASGEVIKNTAVRIMTGAPIPKGADCVVRQEDTDYGEEKVLVYQSLRPFENYCFEGEDYKAGDCLLKQGVRLGAVEIGVLASLGLRTVAVYQRVKTALLTTGDEIVLPEEKLAPGKIYDSNLYMLGSELLSWGMELTCKKRVGDEAQKVADAIEKAATNADIIITTGGVSVGKKDILHEVIKKLECEKLFWRIAIKPGMPTLCAKYKGKLLICLSGNPYGAFVNLELLVRPVLAKLSGRKDLELTHCPAVLKNAFPKKSGVTRFIRGYYEDGWAMVADGSNDSGILSSMCGCNCLIEAKAGSDGLYKGDRVCVILL
jgi:molybdopterin molybdotransferase